MEHLLKVTKAKFEPLLSGDLTFVIHRADRLYSAGDRLILFEVDQGKETGRSIAVRIQYIAHCEDCDGIKDDYCIFSVKRSGKQNRTNSGNHPQSEDEVHEYGSTIGKSAECCKRFFDYYSMSGWKMKNGLPLSDWHAALRNWKDFQAQAPQGAAADKLELLLPLLLKKTATAAKKYKEVHFNDPHIGTLLSFYGYDRLDYPFSAFEVKEMVRKYHTSQQCGTGIDSMAPPTQYGKGTLVVPTIDEFAAILKKRKSHD